MIDVGSDFFINRLKAKPPPINRGGLFCLTDYKRQRRLLLSERNRLSGIALIILNPLPDPTSVLQFADMLCK